MAYVDLDKVINVTGGGGGGVYPDVPYPVLNQRIGIFNKPNARDTDSNGWFGLLGNSVNGICQQNYNFNQQIAVAVDSGVGALSTRVKSYDFSTNINNLDSGQIVFGLMHTPSLNTFSIDEVGKVIDSSYMSDQNISASADNRKSFIITSGGNRYLLISAGATIEVYPIDINNKITGASVTTINHPYAAGYVVQWLAPFAVVNNYVWCISYSYDTNSAPHQDGHAHGMLFSIASNGTATHISSVSISDDAAWNGYHWYARYLSSYMVDNTLAYAVVHTTAHGFSSGTHSTTSYISIDLTNVGAFTYTSLYTRIDSSERDRRYVAGGFDGTGMLVVEGTSVVRFTASGVSASLGTYIGTQYDQCSKKSMLTYYTSEANNISTNSTYMNILGVHVGGDTLSAVYNNMIFIYEPLSTQSEDASFVGCLTNLTPMADGEEIVVSINGSTNNTYDLSNRLYNQYALVSKKVTILSQVIGAVNVDVELSFVNTYGNNLKLGIGITGGTYATPTLPSNNGMSGNQTTARTAGSDASYIDLTLST